jgi:hypothetical protein
LGGVPAGGASDRVVVIAAVAGAGRHRFSSAEVWPALWAAKWELALPIVVLV